MKAKTLALLSSEHKCNLCGNTKPRDEMIVIYLKKEKFYYLRPRCKSCHNEKERGHRREWKREYQKRWRKNNSKLNESYWKGNKRVKTKARINAARRLEKYHDAFLIQGRLRRRGIKVSLSTSKKMLKQFGCCYPTRYGLTAKGLREAERIRSRMRRSGKKMSLFEIRMIIYEDGLHKKPSLQERPYKSASENLSAWHRSRRLATKKEAA